MSEKETRFLPLFLDAPLQSWGYQSRYDRRTTLSYPTRSGIIGMICAAMGIDRSDRVALKQFDRLGITVLGYGREGVLSDYHTVGGGYDRRTQGLFIPITAEGRHRTAGQEAVVTHREYLEGAKFGIILKGESDLLDRISRALRDPAWGIWLGRKCCIPARPVCWCGPYANEEEARRELERQVQDRAVTWIVEETGYGESSQTVSDRPVDFARREFAPRWVKVLPVKGAADKADASESTGGGSAEEE